MAEKEKRLVNHNFRTTESEAAIMRKKMEALGIRNESAYMRALALNGYILKLDLPKAGQRRLPENNRICIE